MAGPSCSMQGRSKSGIRDHGQVHGVSRDLDHAGIGASTRTGNEMRPRSSGSGR